VLEVIEAVDGPIRGSAPGNRNEPPSSVTKKLDMLCGQAADQVRKVFSKTRISDLA